MVAGTTGVVGVVKCVTLVNLVTSELLKVKFCSSVIWINTNFLFSKCKPKTKIVAGEKKSSAKSKTNGIGNNASILDFYKPVNGTSSAADNRLLNND